MVDFFFFLTLEIIKAILFFFSCFFFVMITTWLLGSICFFLYDKFIKKEKEESRFESIYINKDDYHYIYEVVNILTENDERIVNIIKETILKTEKSDKELQYEVNHFICYRLTEYSDEYNGFLYGVALDWKDSMQSGVDSLNDTIVFKQYNVDLSLMEYSQYDSIEDLFVKGNKYLNNYELSLVSWDMGEDTYYLFIIQKRYLNKLITLGTKFNMKFNVNLGETV